MNLMTNRSSAREGLVINLRQQSKQTVEIVARIRQKEARKEKAQKLPKIFSMNFTSLSKSRSTGTHLMTKNMNKTRKLFFRWNNYVRKSKNAKICAELKQQITMR